MTARLRSYHVLSEDGFRELGGWKELDALPARELASQPVAFPVGDALLYETAGGQGWVTASAEGPSWQSLGWSEGISGLQGVWMKGKIHFLASRPLGKLYSWNGSGQPEPMLIPTLLTSKDAALAGAWPLGEEWLFQWSSPRAVWTLFHERAGLEREVPNSELAALRAGFRPKPASEVPEAYRPYLPAGNWTLSVRDDILPEGRAVYTRNNGASAYAVRRGEEVWILSSDGKIRGTSTASVPLPAGLSLVGFMASPHGLLLLWQKAVGASRGHEGVIMLPWSVLEKSATL